MFPLPLTVLSRDCNRRGCQCKGVHPKQEGSSPMHFEGMIFSAMNIHGKEAISVEAACHARWSSGFPKPYYEPQTFRVSGFLRIRVGFVVRAMDATSHTRRPLTNDGPRNSERPLLPLTVHVYRSPAAALRTYNGSSSPRLPRTW